jgi:ABC-type transport system involved in cytochrome bd biosynthesis fused ATPase/permease subunit
VDRAAGNRAGIAKRGSSAHFRDLLNWYRPYLRGCGPLLTFTLGATATLLACQAVTPLAVRYLLSQGNLDPRGAVVLVAVILAQLVLAYLGTQGAARIAAQSERALRTAVFARLLTARGLGEGQLVRSSIVSRHTSDVDHISDAFEATLTSGFPAVARIGQSLVLLAIVEWWAGLTMTLATVAFLLLRRHVGDRLLVADRERMNASTGVAEMVDESVSCARGIAGMSLEGWLQQRFEQRAHALEVASLAQGHKVTLMTTGASAAGLAGMVIVVLATFTPVIRRMPV